KKCNDVKRGKYDSNNDSYITATIKLALGAFESQWGPVIQLHSQSQATCGQDFFDLIERFATQVRGFEQFVFSTLNQIANVVDVFCFQAVGRAYGELEIIYRAQQDRVDLRLCTLRGFEFFFGTL